MSASALLLATMAGGTTMNVMGQLQAGKEAERQGKEAQQLANARAAMYEKDAKAERRRSVEEAKIEEEKGRRLLATQKSAAAAGGIMINTGSPLVIEAETIDQIAKDKGFILEEGRMKSESLYNQAAYERAYGSIMKEQGKRAKKQSLWKAIGTGVSGYGSMAYMGYESGIWGNKSVSVNAANKLNQSPYNYRTYA
jgi:hypothetical protein